VRTYSSSNPTVDTVSPRAQKLFAGDVSFLAAELGHRDGALAFQKANHRRHGMLGWNRDAYMNVIRRDQATLDNLALPLPSQRVKNRTQLLENPPEVGFFRRRLGRNPTWYRVSNPSLNGIGFDRFQALHPLLVGHQATWRGFHSRNGQTFSSLTGRTSGLPIELSESRSPQLLFDPKQLARKIRHKTNWWAHQARACTPSKFANASPNKPNSAPPGHKQTGAQEISSDQ
jgi:hypothetical protein